MGWEKDFLQSAVDTCTNLSGEVSDCPLFDLQPDSSATTCTFEMPSQLEKDDCAGPRDGLCGGVPIQSGPAYASKLSPGVSIQPTTTASPSTPASSDQSVLPTSLGYKPGTSVATDNSGGGITVAQAKAGSNKQTTSTTADYGSYSMVAVQEAPSSTITPTPQLPEGVKLVATSTWTSGGAVYEMVYEEVDVTTTVVVPARRRRHVHHRRGHHAGLGGVF